MKIMPLPPQSAPAIVSRFILSFIKQLLIHESLLTAGTLFPFVAVAAAPPTATVTTLIKDFS
jgi:hypothetical protein